MPREDINKIECIVEYVTAEKTPQEAHENCPHQHTEIRQLAVYCTCEVTAEFCSDCGEQLSEEQWEC